MRVLVTGGAGFIGSNLVFALLDRGDEVAVIDDLSTGSAGNVHPAAAFRRLDVLDPDVSDIVVAFRPDAVVHLAAQVSVAESVKDPEKDRAVNVGGTGAVARASAEAGARRVLSASSAAVYGEPETVPTPEDAPKDPQNPYGASKLAGERALAEGLSGSGVDHASLRFSNVYGPRQDWRGEGGVVAVFTAAMLAGGPVTIFGDGRQTRDFIYVGDVVAAIMAALDEPGPLAERDGLPAAYNVSTGDRTTVLELASELRSLTGYTGEIVHAPKRDGDVEHSALDPGKLAARLRWRADVPLERGLQATVRWFASGDDGAEEEA